MHKSKAGIFLIFTEGMKRRILFHGITKQSYMRCTNGRLLMHLIPRRRNDEIDAWPEFTGAREEIRDVYEKVKM